MTTYADRIGTRGSRRPATDKMVSYMYRLAGERSVPQWGTCGEERIESLGAKFEERQPEFAEVSQMIDWLKTRPRDFNTVDTPQAKSADDFDPQTLAYGVYQVDGVVYVVKPNRDKTRRYAAKVVPVTSDRVHEDGTVDKIEFEYERGAIFRIRPEHRLSLEDAEKLSVRYGRCVCCGHGLKVAKSVQRMIGPVCFKKYF